MAARDEPARSFGHWGGGATRESAAAKAKRGAREAPQRPGSAEPRRAGPSAAGGKRGGRDGVTAADPTGGANQHPGASETRERLDVLARRRVTRDQLRDAPPAALELPAATPGRDTDLTRRVLLRIALAQHTDADLLASDEELRGEEA